MNSKTKKITAIAMLTALSYIVMFVGRVPISSVDFLKYDPKDVIIAVGGFIYGPLTALFISLAVSFVEMVTVSTTGIIGAVMNVVSTVAFACTASLIYKKKRTAFGAVAGLLLGVGMTTALMLLWNYYITP
jgi:riboflavin transporter FmnP